MSTIATVIMFLGMTFNIFQQPINKPLWISHNGLTQFSMANNIALLAHNYEDGKYFSSIKINDTIRVVTKDGSVLEYKVAEIHKYKKHSNQVWENLKTGEIVSDRTIFKKFYANNHKLIMQTCIAYNGNKTWGLLFIAASQIKHNIREWR